MPTLFDILDAAIDNMKDADLDQLTADYIDQYADNAMNTQLTPAQLERVARVGNQWLYDVDNGNGEWSRMRDEAKAALDD